MSGVLLDWALPCTDAGALAQAVFAIVVYAAVLWRVRRSPEVRTFVAGCASLTFAWFAVRTLH